MANYQVPARELDSSKPRARPQVNIPSMHSQMPPYLQPFHPQLPFAPNTTSLSGYPPTNLPDALPVVSLPQIPAYDQQHSFEDKVRGMFLNNPPQNTPQELHGFAPRRQPNQFNDVRTPLPVQRGTFKKPSQTQRKAQRAQQATNNSPPTLQSSSEVEQSASTGPSLSGQPPHLRGFPQSSQEKLNALSMQDTQPNLRSFNQVPQEHQVHQGLNPGFGPTNMHAYPSRNYQNRPTPQHQQLFNASSDTRFRSNNFTGGQYQFHAQRANLQAQVNYLEYLTQIEIPKVEMSPEECEEKQTLRVSLEHACRTSVTNFERKTNPEFVPETIQLKCFGSLSTTFATRDSDMDLVLVSPASKTSVSSTESEVPRLIEKTLLDLSYGVRLLTGTRVPIIKFCQKPSPDLAALLRQEREKWEKESEAPSKQKETRDPNAKRSADAGAEKSKSASPQDPPRVSPDSTTVNSEARTLGTAQGAFVDLPSVDVVLDTSAPGNSTSEAMNSLRQDLEHTNLKPGVLRQTPVGTTGNGDNAQSKEKPTEQDDPELRSKYSDDERVRLYRLAMKEEWYEVPERSIIHRFIQAVEKHNGTGSDTGLDQARDALQVLPNILKQYRAPPKHQLDFPKNGVGIQCDINFSNHLALQNSLLLKCYSLCDPRVRQIVLFVKAWSKKRNVNSPYHGTLSSYGYVLMVLHYLINVAQPPVLINLQLASKMIQADELSAEEVSIDGYDVKFFRNEAVLEDLARRGQITTNREPLGSLLRNFFRYFAQPAGGGFQWTQDVLSLRTPGGILSKQAKGWTGAKTETVEGVAGQKEIRQRYLFSIEDPFEINHNVARTVVHNGIIAIRDEFRRAHKLVEQAGIGEKGPDDLFAEAKGKENLQYRAFGPRWKRDEKSAVHRSQGTKGGLQNDRAKVGRNATTVKEAQAANKSGNGN